MSVRNKTLVNTPEEKPESKRFSDPLESLLVWAELVSDEPIGPLLSSLKIDIAGIKEFKRGNPQLVTELKQINAVARLLDREKTAKLLIVRFNEMLMGAKTPSQFRDLSLAAARIPALVFGEEPDIRAHTRHAHHAQAHTHTPAAREAGGNGVAAGAMCSGGSN